MGSSRDPTIAIQIINGEKNLHPCALLAKKWRTMLNDHIAPGKVNLAMYPWTT
jgi:ArsR family metal-binding transcriptional regulator